jgi:hypothetical protein
VPERVIYDNMKTAVDRVRVGKVRVVNARFQVMCGHYLFEPEFCTVAAGWEKGIVEKNVQDARRRVWADVCEQRWESWQALNAHLLQRSLALWAQSAHPQWPEMVIGDCLQDERAKLMVSPKSFDGYVELLLRVSPTGLIHIQRNRYSVPIGLAHEMVSVRLYPHEIAVVADNLVGRGTRAVSSAIRPPTIGSITSTSCRSSPGACATAHRLRPCPSRSSNCNATSCNTLAGIGSWPAFWPA